MPREEELERKEKLVEEGLQVLGAEVVELKRIHRADFDTMKLEMEVLKLFLSASFPDFERRYQELKEKVRLEVMPE